MGSSDQINAAIDAVSRRKYQDLTAQTDGGIYNDRPNGEASIRGILLHHTGGGSEAGDLAQLSKRHADPVSVQKMIKRDGTVVQIVPNALRAWHAGWSMFRGIPDCNSWMIGYEICNRGNGELYTDAQYEAIAIEIHLDTKQYKIADRNVTTHKIVRDEWLAIHPGSDQRKYDPYKLDIDRIWRRVSELRANGQPAPAPTPVPVLPPEYHYFEETGHTVGHGFLNLFNSRGGLAKFGFPISDEMAAVLNGKTYTVQYFQRARMEYDRETGAITLGLVGAELLRAQGRTPGSAEIDPAFANFYNANGGLDDLGLAVLPAATETLNGQPYQVQWLERARMELHPEGVMLGLVGTELVMEQAEGKHDACGCGSAEGAEQAA